MAAQNPYKNFYPEVDQTNPFAFQDSYSTNHYPTVDMRDMVDNLFPDPDPQTGSENPSAPFPAETTIEEVLIRIPSSIVNLIDKSYSAELASGEFSIVRLLQNDNVVAIFARVANVIQWPLARDEAAVKLDPSHYFFSLRLPSSVNSDSDSSGDEKKGKDKKKRKADASDNVLNYGLTIPFEGNEEVSTNLDAILEAYSCFSVQTVSITEKAIVGSEFLKGTYSSSEMKPGSIVEGKCAAYWTTLAPNVEDYSGSAAKLIASGSGHVIKGILWCGDVTMERLKWGNEVMKKRMNPISNSEVSPTVMRRIKRVKRMTKATNKVANGVLSGVVKVSGFLTSSAVNSKVGKKFCSLVPGQIVLATLDGFNKICDALEVAGKNVMETSSTVTTELVSHRYGESAGRATNEGLDAAGHAIGTAWTVFKIRKALNPKNAAKTSTIAKAVVKTAAAEAKKKAK